MTVLASIFDYSAQTHGMSDMRLSPADVRALVQSVNVPFRVTSALGLEDCYGNSLSLRQMGEITAPAS
jgi:hypothetical protein